MVNNANPYPFTSRVITNKEGQVTEVVLDYKVYKKILEKVEDEGLYIAMLQVKEEIPLSKEDALRELEGDEN